MIKKIILIVFCFTVGMHLTSCTKIERKRSGKLSVFVSIPPQATFVERVGGDRVSVNVLVDPGQSPHSYTPTPAQMAKLAESEIYFCIGVEFEKALVPKIQNSFEGLRIVDTRKNIALRDIEDSDHLEESHTGKQESHEHHRHAQGKDPHIWLDPMLVKVQATTICNALIQADPEATLSYQNNYLRFAEDLDSLHTRIQKALLPVKGKELFVFHPAFGYFAHAYGLKQRAVEIGGKEPSARQLAQLIKTARQHQVRVIFVQPQFSRQSARAVAQNLGAAVVPLDPLAKDYIGNLLTIAEKVEAALR